MRIVHINTYDGNGGAGRAALRLNAALNQAGINSEILCLFQFRKNSNVKVAWRNPVQKAKAVLNIFAERFLIRPYLQNLDIPFALQRFGFSVADLDIIRSADLLHIHWINHGFLASKQLAELSKLNKKIVWTTHDSNLATGGCHVRYECQNYKTGCGNCPVLKRSSPNDLSFRTFRKKQIAYEKLKITFVSPSRWMANAVAKSLLAKDQTVKMIANGLEMQIFKPLDKDHCREELHIENSKFVILAGYMPTKFSRHKGFPELIEIIRNLGKLKSVPLSDIEFVFIGSDGTAETHDLPVKIRFAGTISNDELLVKYYNAADCFLMTSLEESMGYTALESIACGTPVVAFDTSGVKDVVIHQHNGYMAPLLNIDEMVKGIDWVASHADRNSLAANCRHHAVTNFDETLIAKQHIELYQSLLNTNVSAKA